VQRLGGSQLERHLHCVIPDGVFVREKAPSASSRSERPDSEVEAILRRIVVRLLTAPPCATGGDGTEQPDALASAQTETLLLRLRRRSPARDGTPLSSRDSPPRRRALARQRREGLEKLCGYGAVRRSR